MRQGGAPVVSRGVKRVVVIGAGVAGLQATRRLLSIGLDVLCLEGSGDIGGVWAKNYSGYALQAPWPMYVFPDFDYPPHLRPKKTFPSGEEVHAYINAYVEHFKLREHIRLNSKLVHLRQVQSGAWNVLFLDLVADKFYTVKADYVVISTGIYSTPFIPTYVNQEMFQGVQLHAKDFQDVSMAADRSVVIVGAGKTALDCVAEVVALKSARTVTMLYRQAHWPVPRMVADMSIRQFLFNRAIASMLPPYYTAPARAQITHKALKPVKKLFWRSVESLIKKQFTLEGDMLPQVPLPRDLFYGGQILDNNFEKNLRKVDNVRLVRGEIHSFSPNGVFLQDGSFVRADLVLYCTGYSKTYEYLPGDLRAKLDLQKDGLYLYRSIIPPCIANLAFVGAEVSTYNNILSSGLQALWLAHLLAGKVSLPAVSVMQADIRVQQHWRREVMPAQRHRGSVLMLYMQSYHDQLLNDMAIPIHRKGLNKLKEVFAAYSAADYAGLFKTPAEGGLDLHMPQPSPRPEAGPPGSMQAPGVSALSTIVSNVSNIMASCPAVGEEDPQSGAQGAEETHAHSARQPRHLRNGGPAQPPVSSTTEQVSGAAGLHVSIGSALSGSAHSSVHTAPPAHVTITVQQERGMGRQHDDSAAACDLAVGQGAIGGGAQGPGSSGIGSHAADDVSRVLSGSLPSSASVNFRGNTVAPLSRLGVPAARAQGAHTAVTLDDTQAETDAERSQLEAGPHSSPVQGGGDVSVATLGPGQWAMTPPDAWAQQHGLEGPYMTSSAAQHPHMMRGLQGVGGMTGTTMDGGATSTLGRSVGLGPDPHAMTSLSFSSVRQTSSGDRLRDNAGGSSGIHAAAASMPTSSITLARSRSVGMSGDISTTCEDLEPTAAPGTAQATGCDLTGGSSPEGGGSAVAATADAAPMWRSSSEAVLGGWEHASPDLRAPGHDLQQGTVVPLSPKLWKGAGQGFGSNQQHAPSEDMLPQVDKERQHAEAAVRELSGAGPPDVVPLSLWPGSGAAPGTRPPDHSSAFDSTTTGSDALSEPSGASGNINTLGYSISLTLPASLYNPPNVGVPGELQGGSDSPGKAVGLSRS